MRLGGGIEKLQQSREWIALVKNYIRRIISIDYRALVRKKRLLKCIQDNQLILGEVELGETQFLKTKMLEKGLRIL